MKVVVSVGGSVLAPDLEPDRVEAYADVVQTLVDAGHRLGAVVGGGPTAREYIETARELGANEIELDQLGIAVTRLNGRLLTAALDDLAAPAPAESYDEGRAVMRRGEVPVLGGIVAAQTTDAVAASFAEYVDADLLVYATSVPGVYDADPNQDPDATRFDELTADELVDIVVGNEMNAGSNAPVDLLAAKVIQRSGIEAVVLDGTDPDRVRRAVQNDEVDGTTILPGA
ncbi:UMP kinase [Halomicroarcula sp. GCM10025324]|uniref:UMP kinase n=1 Tax=Haloarcula TaxID=2237 RepID=UPI0023E801E3|nr:UMP kinase [Halomicroarcula sp. ZS-22-S1]